MHVELGVLEAQLGDNEAAERTLEQALELQPEDPRALAELAKLRQGGADWDGYAAAREREAEVAATAAQAVEALVDAARVHMERRKDDQAAKRALERALQKDPDAPEAIALYGSLARRLLDDKTADALAEKELGREPPAPPERQAELHAGLGASALRRGETDEAARRFREAVAARPGYPPAIQGLADLGGAVGRVGRGRGALARRGVEGGRAAAGGGAVPPPARRRLRAAGAARRRLSGAARGRPADAGRSADAPVARREPLSRASLSRGGAVPRRRRRSPRRRAAARGGGRGGLPRRARRAEAASPGKGDGAARGGGAHPSRPRGGAGPSGRARARGRRRRARARAARAAGAGDARAGRARAALRAGRRRHPVGAQRHRARLGQLRSGGRGRGRPTRRRRCSTRRSTCSARAGASRRRRRRRRASWSATRRRPSGPSGCARRPRSTPRSDAPPRRASGWARRSSSIRSITRRWRACRRCWCKRATTRRRRSC